MPNKPYDYWADQSIDAQGAATWVERHANLLGALIVAVALIGVVWTIAYTAGHNRAVSEANVIIEQWRSSAIEGAFCGE